MAKELASEMLCVFKNLDDGQSPKKGTLCQLTLVMLYSLFCVHMVMQALLWFQLVRFRTVQFGVAWLGPSYANLR